MLDLLEYKILPEDYNEDDKKFKIIFIGDIVGKTNILNNAIRGIFKENSQTTIRFEFFIFNIKIENKVNKLQIWVLAQQKYLEI